MIEIDEVVFLPIINGFIAVPDIGLNKRLTLTEGLVAVVDSTFTRMHGRLFFVLPEFNRVNQYPEDWFRILRAASHI